ncbi:MAG TPA: hypothetical protein VFJ16_20900 [Longimicrobium sp.]|nr:hypothetical protein [Longimicrobium sp.]
MDASADRAPPHDAGLAAEARQHLESAIERATRDMEFRRLLLTSPLEALAEHFGRPMPEGLNVRFAENVGGSTIVLPDPLPGCEWPGSRLIEAQAALLALLDPSRPRD